MMAKELEITTTMDFDKQDIVTVAVANIEALIRKNVRDSKARRNELTKKIADTHRAIQSAGETSVPKVMAQKSAQIEKALKSAGLVKTIGARIKFNLADLTNDYQLHIVKKDNLGKFIKESISIMYKSTDFTKKQKALMEKVSKMEKNKTTIISDGVKWKAKLSDMSAVERQMRAKVVEAQLNKTAEGKALVNILTKNYEKTIKLIEM